MLARVIFIILISFACISCGGGSSDSEPEIEVDKVVDEVEDTSMLANHIIVGDITFHFDKEYAVGQFVDGQWWVHNYGDDVVVTSMTPASFNDGGRIRNGAELNPVNSSEQGFDGLGDAGVTVDMPYSANKNVDPGVTGASLTLTPNNSVVKAISKEENTSRSLLEQAAILTVLETAPTGDVFRPAYAGTDKSLMINLSDIDYSVLGKYAPLSDTPHIETYLPYITGVWLDHNSEWTQRDIHPESSMPVYGREIARFTSEVALQLQLDYTNEEKEAALIAIVQHAIDIYAVLQLSPLNDKENYYWYNNGGHNQGRKIQLLIAGLVLNHSGMLAIANAEQESNLLFQEDQQTFYVTQDDIDYTFTADQIADGDKGYQQADLGLAEWATRPWDRRESTLNSDWGSRYRVVNGCNAIVTALAVHMMGAVDYWNRDVFFDYADRYFSREGDINTESFNGNEIRRVPADLWREHRDKFSEVYTGDLTE